MDEQFKSMSTSSDTIFSQLSLQDNAFNSGIISTLPPLSVLSPLRSSITLGNISNFLNAPDHHSFFLNEFDSERSFPMTRWSSDAESLNLKFNSSSNQPSSSTEAYLMNELITNPNMASSSISDSILSPMSRLSTSSSAISFSSLSNQKVNNQPSSRATTNNLTDLATISNDNASFFSTASSFLPMPPPNLNRRTLSSIDNLSYPTSDNDLQRVPPSFFFKQTNIPNGNPTSTQTQAQIFQTATRSNNMPSWRGQLPIKSEPQTFNQYQNANTFSQKVFLGGIPSELTEAELLLVLRKFGKCNIKWPKNNGPNENMPGFCHVIYRESRSVCELLKHCTRQQRSTVDYFLHIQALPSVTSMSIRTARLKPIQVVPWNVKDSVYVSQQQENVPNNGMSYKDWSRTIFVSPLHGKMTAYSLSSIMSNVFGYVVMAQINTDKYGYPTGTGTVLFSDSHSYIRAVAAGAIDVKSDCFHKLLDIDPFLRENEPCAFCPSVADYFCRNFHCLRSYCKTCWINRHGNKPLADHQPATRRQQPLPLV